MKHLAFKDAFKKNINSNRSYTALTRERAIYAAQESLRAGEEYIEKRVIRSQEEKYYYEPISRNKKFIQKQSRRSRETP